MKNAQVLTSNGIFKARELLTNGESLEAVARELNVRQSTVARYLPELADAARARTEEKATTRRYMTKVQMVNLLRAGLNLELKNLEASSYETVEQLFRKAAQSA